MNVTWLPFEWIVAWRFLREGRLQTLFILGGIAIGVAVIVFMSAMLTGLQANFIKRVLSAQAHIQLLPAQEVTRPLRTGVHARPGEIEAPIVQAPLQRTKSLDQWQALASQISAMPEVVVVSPVASGSGLITRGSASRAINLSGIVPERHYRIIDMQAKLVRGQTRLGNSDILLGMDLAEDLG